VLDVRGARPLEHHAGWVVVGGGGGGGPRGRAHSGGTPRGGGGGGGLHIEVSSCCGEERRGQRNRAAVARRGRGDAHDPPRAGWSGGDRTDSPKRARRVWESVPEGLVEFARHFIGCRIT